MKNVLGFSQVYLSSLSFLLKTYSLGIFSSTDRDKVRQIYDKFNNGAAGSLALPAKPPSEIFELTQTTKTIFPAHTNGNTDMLEYLLINYLVSAYRPRRIFEFGTFNGRTTMNMAINTPPATQIFTLDLPAELENETALSVEDGDLTYIRKKESGALFREVKNLKSVNKIHQLYGDSASFDFSPYFNTIDFIFIDASHHYEYVKNDTQIALKLLKKQKGVILWHDYSVWPGVTKALNELYETSPFNQLVHIKDTSLALLVLE